MTDQPPRASQLPPEMVGSLLLAALRVQKKGNREGARALLGALARQQPDEPRVWAALAAVAQTRDEQRQALERLVALDPQHPLGRRAATLLGDTVSEPTTTGAGGTDGSTAPATAIDELKAAVPAVVLAAPVSEALPLGPAPSLTPTEPQHPAQDIRWPIFVVIGVMGLAVLLAALFFRPAPVATDTQSTPSLPFSGGQTSVPIGATTAPTEAPAVGATIVPVPTSAAAVSTLPATSAPPPPSPTTRATPRPTAVPMLAPGQVIEQGQWHVSLLRPEHALPLDGSIGALQPQGRFVLALVVVGNNGSTPTRLPTDLVTLVDRRGMRYLPLPAASTAYLTLYGRAQHGDLSLEEAVPAGGGNVSVPLIFDVPPGAGGLALHVGTEQTGWPVDETARTSAPATTPVP